MTPYYISRGIIAHAIGDAVGEEVPDTRSLALIFCGTFDLVCRARETPFEIFGKFFTLQLRVMRRYERMEVLGVWLRVDTGFGGWGHGCGDWTYGYGADEVPEGVEGVVGEVGSGDGSGGLGGGVECCGCVAGWEGERKARGIAPLCGYG